MSRMILRPGLTAVRHDDAHLQVGHVVLADTAPVRRLLATLASPEPGEPPDSLPARRALAALTAADAVVPAPTSPTASWLAGAYGSSHPERAAARAAAAVSLTGPAALVGPVSTLLKAAGVLPVDGPGSLAVVLSLGPVRRSLLDEHLRSGVPHLPVAGTASCWEVGPLVVPGQTACLRCVDLDDPDPRRPLVVDQLAQVADSTPVDPVAQSLALALVVREVLAYVDGDLPDTWSAVLTLPAVGLPSSQAFARHPLCGCAWDALAD
ncbi:hypothetical protein [Nocardioides sp.]|uniref:hypothetical protein n=1 Tax=Nocardioides sp. TaxID=35761 RepID=UPI0039E31093